MEAVVVTATLVGSFATAWAIQRTALEALLRSRGIEPDVVFRTDESRALQRLVGAGVGHALVPLMSIDAPVPGMVIVDASRRVPARRLGIAWHRDVTLPEPARRLLIWEIIVVFAVSPGARGSAHRFPRSVP